jgi:NADH-quinone oxidoreductase subunit G
MLAQPRKAWVLYGIEPEHDFADTPTALRALAQGGVVAFTAFADETTRRMAQVMLPIGLVPEIEASFTNVDGLVQTTAAAAKLPGEARAGWRVLRALGEHLGLAGFDFTELAQWRERMAPRPASSGRGLAPRGAVGTGLESIATRAIYGVDAVLRRAAPLQAHPLAQGARLMLHPDDAEARGLQAGAMARIDDGRGKAALPVEIGACVPRGAAWIEKGYAATAPIAGTGASLTVTRA